MNAAKEFEEGVIRLLFATQSSGMSTDCPLEKYFTSLIRWNELYELVFILL
jgi:hypothetical protein